MCIFISYGVHMDRLTAMQVFSEVAQRGSFTAAADQLGMTRVMVTRYVNDLEQWLGTRLLQRSTRRISLTASGESCLARCRRMLELSAEIQEGLDQRDQTPKGQLRITTSMSFGIAHLAAAISDYQTRYPEVSVDMLMLDRSVNLIEDRIDLAIRITSELDPGLVARRIAPCRSIVCASPRYIERHGLPESPEDLSRHNCLIYSNFGKKDWHFFRGDEHVSVQVSGNLSANEATVLTQAMLAGAGVGLQPTYLVGPLIQSGQLLKLLPAWHPPELTIWGVYLSRKHLPASLRTMLDFLTERFGKKPIWDPD